MVAALTALVRVSVQPEQDFPLNSQDALVLYAIGLVILVPFSEELLFRGFLMTGLQVGRYGAGVAVIVSAALWASAHSVNQTFEYGALFLFGCALGLLRIKYKSILPAFAVHCLNNLGALILMIGMSPS